MYPVMTLKSVLEKNHVNVSGRGSQPIVFAHGFGCDQTYWRYIAPSFESDYQIVRFDFIGCGHSSLEAFDPKVYCSLDGYAEDLLELCRALDLNNVIVVAHGISCMIAMHAAIQEPGRFSRIIQICPCPSYVNDENYKGGFERKDIDEFMAMMEKDFLGWSNTFVSLMMGNMDNPMLSRELAESIAEMEPDIASCFAKTVFYNDSRSILESVRTPSLILQCTDDMVGSLEAGTYVHEHLPNSAMHVLETSGHCPHITAHLETIRAIRNYLDVDAHVGADYK